MGSHCQSIATSTLRPHSTLTWKLITASPPPSLDSLVVSSRYLFSRSPTQHTTTSNDFFIQSDSALQMISSALRKSQKTPAAANCLRTLDLNYSSLIRSAYEALQKASEEELEEGEEVSVDLKESHDVQETLIALYRGKRLRISTLIDWPTVYELRV